MSREPTEGMLKAGKEAYDQKLADMSSPYPTEEPGIGPLGYAYIAMHDAAPERGDAARLAAHCQSLIDVIDTVQETCGEPIAEEDMDMVRHIETVAESALSTPAASVDAEAVWYFERIREEVKAGRTQNALTYLSSALAAVAPTRGEPMMFREWPSPEEAAKAVAALSPAPAARMEEREERAAAFDKIVAARKAHIDTVNAYNARLIVIRAERERGTRGLNTDHEYREMSEAARVVDRLVRELADAALEREGRDNG